MLKLPTKIPNSHHRASAGDIATGWDLYLKLITRSMRQVPILGSSGCGVSPPRDGVLMGFVAPGWGARGVNPFLHVYLC